MTQPSHARLDKAVAALPQRYPGPGGAVAVLRDGKVLARHGWGWADVERRQPFTPQTMALVCSITKQFTCALLLDQFPDPTVLDDEVRRLLPGLRQNAPGILDLCHNQSGLRDYWALAMLCGSAVEGRFGPADARRLIGRAGSLQFMPGTRYSYANQNFRILSDIIEARAGRPFADLLRTRILDRAAMPTAALNPETEHVIGGAIGYEGSLADGFRPAVNRIHWTGDAGLAASLDDMIAWESFIDATRDEAGGLYNRLAAPQSFRDGAPARYGFGLSHAPLLDCAATSHGGGLRGWRSFRFYAPAERISVVVLFNHMADPHEAALDLFGALLDEPAPAALAASSAGWEGRYEVAETGLAARVQAIPEHKLQLFYAPGPDTLAPAAGSEFAGGEFAGGGARLYKSADEIWMDRPPDHLTARLLPCVGESRTDIEGVFHSDELGADLTCTSAGGALYGAFSGELGQRAMQSLLPFGPDVWLLPCARALDYTAPGDWTLKFRRDAGGKVVGVRVGCWLARGIEYISVTA